MLYSFKMQKDVLVVSCDLIAEVKLHQMADIHRTYDATLTVLLACNEMKDNENGENQKIKRKKDMLSTTQSFFVVKLINV